MPYINRVEIMGHLGRDPETRHMQDGTMVTNFSVATTKKWTDKASGEKRERTEWHRIVAFRKTGELCGKYLKKGSLVYIVGELQTREWEKDGIKRQTTEIVANDALFLDGRKKEAKREPGDEYDPGPPPATDNDDIPF